MHYWFLIKTIIIIIIIIKYSEHVGAKLIKATKCLFVLRSLQKEGFSQGEVDHLFSALVLPNSAYGLPVYGAVDSDLTVIQNVLDRCFKKKYTSKRMDIRELLEKADKKLFKVRSVDQKQTCSSSGDKD